MDKEEILEKLEWIKGLADDPQLMVDEIDSLIDDVATKGILEKWE